MDNFKTFLEDLASGRPAKKPVSSNLLKQRAKDNEKALKSGFMKLTPKERAKESKRLSEDYSDHKKNKYQLYSDDKTGHPDKKAHDDIHKAVTHKSGELKHVDAAMKKHEKHGASDTASREAIHKHFTKHHADKKGKTWNFAEEYEPHYMYKGDDKVYAKTKEDHDRLNKKGYDHDDPKTKKVEEEKKNCGCGQDPCITYGKGGTKEKEMNEISLKLMGKHARASIKQVGQMQKLKDDPKTPRAVKKAADDTIRKRSKGLDKTWGAQNESTRDKYNPKISDIRNKEKMKKVGLPAGKGPLVQEDENILEVSDALKSRYIAKANMEISNLEKAKDSAHKDMGKDSAPVEKHMDKKATKRRKGVQQARKDLKRPKKFNTSKNMWEEKQKGIDGKVCWDGYKRMGTKKKGGKTVDNCVKAEDYVIDAIENYYLTELSPKTISSYQKKAGAQYRQLRKDGPTKRQDVENAYHQGYTSDKEYNKQHDDITKMKKRGRGLAASKGKGLQKEDSNWPRPFTKPERNEFLKKKHIQKVKPATNRAKNSAIKEEEMDGQLYELKKSTLKSYLKKTLDPDTRRDDSHVERAAWKRETVQGGWDKDEKKYANKRVKASEKGVRRAVKKLGGDKTMAGRYIKKNIKDKAGTFTDHASTRSGTLSKDPDFSGKTEKKRNKGMKRAINRLGKEAGVKESVVKEGAMKRMATDKEESERLSASKGTFPGNDLATFKKKAKSVHNANKALEKNMGLKKTKDSGIKKVKGGYERKSTYTREEQIQLMTNLDLDESIGNLVRRGVGKVQDAIKQAEKKHGPVDPAKRNIPNPVSGDNIAKRLYGKSQKKRLMK